MRKSRGYCRLIQLTTWTKERCHEEALKYTSKRQLRKNSSSCYYRALKNNWLIDICSHMKCTNKKPKDYWTKEKCHEEALKYTSRGDFYKNSGSASIISSKNNWMNEICSHMKQIKKEKEYWTKERCHKEALKYKTRSEYNKKSVSSYSKAWEKHWLDDICSHMTIVGNKYKKCIYVYEFKKTKTVYVGLTFNIEVRNEQHLKRGPVFIYLKNGIKPLFKKLTDYIDVEEAKIKEQFFVDEYRNSGWNVLNTAKPGAIGGGIRKWTKEKCLLDAKTYVCKKDYRNNSKGYRAALRNNWLVEIYKICGFEFSKRFQKNEYFAMLTTMH